MTNFQTVIHKFYDEYVNHTPKKLKIVDAYLLYIVLTGVTQFVYCCLVGTFPFNSFLSGFISTISCFVLGGKHWLNFVIRSSEWLTNWLFVQLQFQCAYVCKQIQRTNHNSLAFHRNEVLLISFWPMLSYTLSFSISLVDDEMTHHWPTNTNFISYVQK